MTNESQHRPEATRANEGNDATVLVPPQLPPFLATVFDLKPIKGPPTAGEVKLVHAAMRAMSSFLHTDELQLHHSSLVTELSQHLFDIQMTRYREKYTVGIFPNDTVYTPPTLPAYIPVKLEPVVGPPSDNELRAAHSAHRVVDNLGTNVTSLFDADLSMQLSQHIFDLQLARHIQRSTQSSPLTTRPPQQPGIPTHTNVQGSSAAHRTIEISSEAAGPRREGGPTATTEPNDAQRSDITQRGEPPIDSEHDNNNVLLESAKVLVEMRETLKDISKILVASQNSLARGLNSSARSENTGYSFGAHSLINSKGETPEMHGLPTLHDRSRTSGSVWAGNLTTNVLARYLRFYGIGSEMIEDGEELAIRAGMEKEARVMLTRRLYAHVS